ncbi:MAG: hypothetical protein CME30_00520 [Gemmatimonadetes bacterium]|nr:hypothetical protein [Gemmatimonadota bacterium]
MILQMLIFIVSLILVCVGANLLVTGATKIASAAGVSGLVIGLTVVSLGTSAPELFISVIASINGNPDLALGNVLGSNMANIGLVLALTAIVVPGTDGLAFRRPAVRRDFYVMGAITVLVGVFLVVGVFFFDSTVGMIPGGILVLILCWYLFKVVSGAKKRQAGRLDSGSLEKEEEGLLVPRTVPGSWAFVALGVGGLTYGSFLLRESVTYFAQVYGVSELIIAWTMVSVGTSLPELATSITAALRNAKGLAIGNIVGSNIFNMTLVLGAASVASPIDVSPEVISLLGQYPALLLLTAVLIVLGILNSRISRQDGWILFILYLAIMGGTLITTA